MSVRKDHRAPTRLAPVWETLKWKSPRPAAEVLKSPESNQSKPKLINEKNNLHSRADDKLPSFQFPSIRRGAG
jgi:hypothetical protein